ncbi:hypothetical protein H8D51_01265, partial [bacterium]|nr:hypothetical protein [bacterium]
MFILRETWRVLSHMRGKLLLVVLLLTLSGVLVGLLTILYYNSSVVHHSFQRHLQGELFLQDDCTDLQRADLEERLQRDTLVTVDHFRSREEARELFAAEFGDEIFQVLEENPLPASFLFHFRFPVVQDQMLEDLVSRYKELPGVLSLRTPSRMLRLLHQRITFVLQLISAVLLVLLSGTT